MRFRERMARFMYGRNGADQLGFFILILNLIVIIVSLFFRGTVVYTVLWFVSVILIALYLFRAFSRKTDRRRKENEAYLRIKTGIKDFFSHRFEHIRNFKKYRYRKCKYCKAVLRLPAKKGGHTVKCPKCGNSFEINIVL